MYVFIPKAESSIMDKTDIKVVLFDHDDTLVATISAKWAQHKYIAKTFYGKDLEDEEIRQHWGKPFSLLVKLLYETEDGDQAMSYNIALREQYPKQLFADTPNTIKKLREAGIIIGLVTATTLPSLENDFKTLEVSREWFDYIQTEERTTFHKPDPRVFDPSIQWLKEQGIATSQVLYVGDSLSDMRAALGAGFHFIGVATGLVTMEDFNRNQVQAVSRLSELLEK
jgi:HAD superfamily hydrolase (TIGR01549 family)